METKKIDEKELRNRFNLSDDLKREFGGDFESFKAFSEADLAGRIGICTPGNCQMMTVAEFHNSQELTRLTAELEKKTAALKQVNEKIAEDEKRQAAAGVTCEP